MDVGKVVATSCAVDFCTVFRMGPCILQGFILRAVTVHFCLHSHSADPGHSKQPGAEKATDGSGCFHEDSGLSFYGHLLWRTLPGGRQSFHLKSKNNSFKKKHLWSHKCCAWLWCPFLFDMPPIKSLTLCADNMMPWCKVGWKWRCFQMSWALLKMLRLSFSFLLCSVSFGRTACISDLLTDCNRILKIWNILALRLLATLYVACFCAILAYVCLFALPLLFTPLRCGLWCFSSLLRPAFWRTLASAPWGRSGMW